MRSRAAQVPSPVSTAQVGGGSAQHPPGDAEAPALELLIGAPEGQAHDGRQGEWRDDSDEVRSAVAQALP